MEQAEALGENAPLALARAPMIAEDRIDRQFVKLLVADAVGAISSSATRRAGLLVSARRSRRRQRRRDAARELARPAPGERIEARLAGWVSFRDPTHFVAVALGAGDHRVPTENPPLPPPLSAGDQLEFGPLIASVEGLLDHPRLVHIRFVGSPARIIRGLVQHGRPVQYAHIPEPLRLWDVWTKIAADPIAFESPSAGFALDWRTLKGWRERGVAFATLSHAAGLSSTGDAALDQRLPFDEFYCVREACARAVEAARSRSGSVIAIGTSVVRVLESAANADGMVRAGEGRASGRIARGAPLRAVDAILTGVHQTGESH
jgi:S-adenosylmethionine:tRNA ribosyltransferase-isomerase